jgi:hypothetical protein
MAHYAFLDENNNVTEVITGKDETDILDGLTPEEWYGNFRGQRCVRTSFNHRIRKQFASIGMYYDEARDAFLWPRPFPSWTLDENNDWQPPTQRPIEGNWKWDETKQEWQPVE